MGDSVKKYMESLEKKINSGGHFSANAIELEKVMSDREIMDAKFSTLKSNKAPEHLFRKDINKMPNQKWHQIISFIKSGIRILGYGALWFSLDIAVILLILSEVVGIGEELV